jgi:small neutral amino acid transporter SnatA (MarC family)
MEAAYCSFFFFFYTVFAVIVVLYRMYASHSSLTTFHDVGEGASRARRVRISHKTWRKPRPKSSKFP